jgi:hypothetical protein
MNPPTNRSKNPASSPLDTEIRRAMGELANAAPPVRPPESLGTEFGPLETVGTSSSLASGPSSESGARRWVLAAAAAVVVAVVGVSLVFVTSDDSTTSISDTPWVAERPTPERAMSERTRYGHLAHRQGWARAGRTSADVSGRTG